MKTDLRLFRFVHVTWALPVGFVVCMAAPLSAQGAPDDAASAKVVKEEPAAPTEAGPADPAAAPPKARPAVSPAQSDATPAPEAAPSEVAPSEVAEVKAVAAPEPTAVPEPPAQSASAPPAEAAEAAVPAAAAAPRTMMPPMVRFRAGAGASGGAFFGSAAGGMVGVYGQAGVQLMGILGLYYHVHAWAGAFMDDSQATTVGFLWNSVIADLMVANGVAVGLGPSVDFNRCRTRVGPTDSVCEDKGPSFGSHARVALSVGAEGVSVRGPVVISSDVHATIFASGAVLAFTLGVGGQL